MLEEICTLVHIGGGGGGGYLQPGELLLCWGWCVQRFRDDDDDDDPTMI